jgi:uncharacterized protein (DUF697 family)
MSDEANAKVKSIIFRTSLVSVAFGVILSPIPLADELLLVPLYGVMAARIGRARGLGMTRVPWRPIGAAVVAGLASRAAFNVSFAFIPGVAAVANAVTAAALTQLVGGYADNACREGTAPAASGAGAAPAEAVAGAAA